MIAVLSLGGNLGDPAATIDTALDSLGTKVLKRSSLYRSAPVGGVEQDDFINATALVAVSDPLDALAIARELETAAERQRDIRWGPRTLDVDVIVVDDVLIDDAELTLPHPRAHERAFVLLPWLEIDPDAQLPGHGLVAALLDGIVGQEVSQL